MMSKRSRSVLAVTVYALLLQPAIISSFGNGATAADNADRTVGQYLCKDLMRQSGENRAVSLAFLHGYLLGKNGKSEFNIDALGKATDAFIEHCLDNPSDKAVDAMETVKK